MSVTTAEGLIPRDARQGAEGAEVKVAYHLVNSFDELVEFHIERISADLSEASEKTPLLASVPVMPSAGMRDLTQRLLNVSSKYAEMLAPYELKSRNNQLDGPQAEEAESTKWNQLAWRGRMLFDLAETVSWVDRNATFLLLGASVPISAAALAVFLLNQNEYKDSPSVLAISGADTPEVQTVDGQEVGGKPLKQFPWAAAIVRQGLVLYNEEAAALIEREEREAEAFDRELERQREELGVDGEGIVNGETYDAELSRLTEMLKKEGWSDEDAELRAYALLAPFSMGP